MNTDPAIKEIEPVSTSLNLDSNIAINLEPTEDNSAGSSRFSFKRAFEHMRAIFAPIAFFKSQNSTSSVFQHQYPNSCERSQQKSINSVKPVQPTEALKKVTDYFVDQTPHLKAEQLSCYSTEAFLMKAIRHLEKDYDLKELLDKVKNTPINVQPHSSKQPKILKLSQVYMPFPGEEVKFQALLDLKKGEKTLPTSFELVRIFQPTGFPVCMQLNGWIAFNRLPKTQDVVVQELYSRQENLKHQLKDDPALLIKAKQLLQLKRDNFEIYKDTFLELYQTLANVLVDEEHRQTVAKFYQYAREVSLRYTEFADIHQSIFSEILNKEEAIRAYVIALKQAFSPYIEALNYCESENLSFLKTYQKEPRLICFFEWNLQNFHDFENELFKMPFTSEDLFNMSREVLKRDIERWL